LYYAESSRNFSCALSWRELVFKAHTCVGALAHAPIHIDRHIHTRHWPKKLDYFNVGREGRRHAEIEKIMASQPIDFVQISYSALDRDVERRILPLTRERKIGVIVNRPFRQGDLTQRQRRL
jgi:hypothetical protein